MKMPGTTTVLILERSQTFAMYLALLLRRMGLQSLAVSTVAAAREALARGGVDFLLVGEPGGGCQITTAVQILAGDPAGSRLPMVAIALRENEVERQACLQAGCRTYLLRPVQPRELHRALYANLAFAAGGRQHLRSSVTLNATVSLAGAEPRVVRLLTLSRGGALCAWPEEVPVGTPLALTLPLPDGEIPLGGSVIYNRRSPDAEAPFGFAVLFDRDSLGYGDRIDRFLELMLQQECAVATGRD
jgi:CheY-like chemotaxis protein